MLGKRREDCFFDMKMAQKSLLCQITDSLKDLEHICP